MADATKQASINGGNLISELKNIFSLLRAKRAKALAFAFMFAFIAFTVFLAFNPSSNSSSPWFTNIFSSSSSSSSSSSTSTSTSTSSPSSTTIFSDKSNRSHFSSIFSFFFPNSSQQFHDFFPPPSPINATRSQNLTVQSPHLNKQPPTVENQTRNNDFKHKLEVLNPNQTNNGAPISPISANYSANSPPKSSPEMKNITGKGANLNSSSSGGSSAEQRSGNLGESLMNCDLYDGEWVKDESYPLYKPGSCSLIDEQFNCFVNGRPDSAYHKLKWKPKSCSLPRLNGRHMLELLRGKRLVFVGDSLNRNMWESLVCILRNSLKDQTRVYEAYGRQQFRTEASYSFVFKDYDSTVELFVSPFLVQEWEMTDKNGLKKETLRLDLVAASADQYKSADFLIFNTGHWWTHEKTSKGKDYYQEGSHVYSELNVVEAFRRALTTWGRWVDANINPMKTLVFFRGYSATHFSGGQWNSGGQCDHETEPIKNETFLSPYPPKMAVLDTVLRGMRTRVSYLNITRMTDFRKDGHPSIFRKQNLPSPLRFQDCSHWCLPGVPDAWNELLYAEILIKQNQLHQHQQ
ncbi:hypothetical protein U1Q18_012742 [Sarracenia purpurea var. burkii]